MVDILFMNRISSLLKCPYYLFDAYITPIEFRPFLSRIGASNKLLVL